MSDSYVPRRAALIVPALAAVLALSACSPAAEGPSGDKLSVVTTTTQLADFAHQIGGDDIELTSLLAPGASAHHFDPSPKELVALSQADVLIVNGADLEGFIDSTIEASGFSGTLVTAADGIDLAEAKEITAEGEHEADTGEAPDHAGHTHADNDHADDDHAGHEHGDHDHDHADHDHAGHDHADHDHADHDHADHDHADVTETHADEPEAHGDHADHDGHSHGDTNPHLWTSPRYASGMAAEVGRALAQADPGNAADYERRATAYEAQLAALDTWVAEQFELVPAADRVLVSGHDSLRYYLHDYGIAYAGAIMPSFEDNAEPSAAELDALSAKIAERGVKAIFVESSMSPKLAQAIARETGITVVDGDALYADSLGTKGSGAETFVAATVHNTQVILEAWGVTPGPVPAELEGGA
ncbi:metal ABC transporter substrate-binding protein [Leucobacter albus]|uniref:Metal ABC transporter substrate-binding protein n=1 Tax=Leucobacter albus TaxID=272210 RepID=A0ABW3TRI5_9MICO